jgi:hypothetical protein
MNTVIAIILFLIILIAWSRLYDYVNPPLLVDENVINLNRTSSLDITISTEEDPANIRYFYDGWLRINQVQNNDKNLIVFSRNSTKPFVLSLKGHNLSLYQLSEASKINTTDGTWSDTNGATTITTLSPNFPFQKWVYFCINVEGNQIDTYLDGKLVSNVKSKDINKVGGSPGEKLDFNTYSTGTTIKVGNKHVTGSLARFRREVGNMDTQSVWNTYMLGPGVNDNGDIDSPDYHAKVNLLRNSKPRRTFNIF